jgi:Bromodomain/TAZ zinc finger
MCFVYCLVLLIKTPVSLFFVFHSVRLLEKDKQTSPESASKMPQMAKQLEVSLYREAPSKEAYLDMSTLKPRLQQIAQEVAKKSQNRVMNGSSNYPHQSQQQPPQQSQQHQIQQQPSQQQGYNNPNNKMMRQDINGTASPYMSTSNNSSAGPMVCMDDINPMAQGNGYPMGSTNHRSQRPPSAGAGVPSNNGNNRSNNDDMKIKHKQQRLLLLHHSAKCTNDTNCPITQHCAEMRRLWRHMEGCKDNRCDVPHCFSSRAILSHYRKCKNNNCPACVPVKDAVRKSRTNSSRMSGGGSMMDRLRGSTTPNQGLSQSLPSDSLGTSTGVPYASSLPNGAANNFANGRGPISRSAMPPPVSQPGHSSQYAVNTSAQAQQHPQNQNQQQPTSNGNSVRSASASQGSQSGFRQERNADARNASSRTIRDETNASDRIRNNADRVEPEDVKIRHKVQRLLLLRHANKCKFTGSECPTTPHCASMKRLWAHISDCKDQSCQFAHCMSSRYVLSHYRRCQDPKCPACAPVRESINRADQGDRRKTGGRISTDNSTNGSDAIGPSSSSPPPFFSSGDSVQPLQPIGAASSNHQLLSSPNSQQTSPTGEPENKRIKTDSTLSMDDEDGFNPPFPARSSSSPPQAVRSLHDMAPDAATSAERVAAPNKSMTKEDAKLSVDNSLLNSFTVKQLETHLASLDRKTQLPPAKLKSKCTEVLKGMQTHQHGWVFNSPVDPVELGLPDYFDIIKKPMDLGTVQKRLENGFYHSIDEFAIDVNLTFDNATTYNEDGSVVYNMATELKTKFSMDLRKLYDQLEAEDRERRQNERACTLCGCEKLNFEPPVYFCNGMNCQSQRIRRNSHFYIGGNNQYFWCIACYNELDDKRPIELVDMTIQKSDLKKKKNDEQHEESWVQCDFCNSWVHQICGLFNTRQNKEHQSEYCCPKCLLHKRRTTDITPCIRTLSAADLPRTILSEWLEQNISKKVEAKKKELASGKAESEVRIANNRTGIWSTVCSLFCFYLVFLEYVPRRCIGIC